MVRDVAGSLRLREFRCGRGHVANRADRIIAVAEIMDS
jgi:hypothetical protein